jgi:SRSO17 transposase
MEVRFEKRKRALLEECQVAPQVFQDVLPRLEQFSAPFVASLCRQEQRDHAQTYLRGLLSDLESKNVESIAYRFGQDRMGLQRFVGVSDWSEQPLRVELVRQVGQELGTPDGVLVFDPSSFPKSGRESVGVARQWCGRLGKVENCQVGVYLGYVSEEEHALVDVRLYLPKEWTKDKARCEKAGIPKEKRTYRTRHQLCLEMLQEHGRKLPHAWIAGDDELGRPYAFRQQLDRLREQYLLAIPSNLLIRDLEAPPPEYGGRGRYPQRPWQRVDAWAAAQPPEAWRSVEVRDGAKGPLTVEILTRRVVGRTPQHQEGHPEVLVVIRYRDRDRQILKHDYYLSNASPHTSPAEFARVAKAEHRIEECLQRSKSEAGLADYEVRTWKGWHHHQTLSLIATWFLVSEARRGKKMDPGDYRAPDSRGLGGDPAPGLRLRNLRPHPPRARETPDPQRTRSLVSLETT